MSKNKDLRKEDILAVRRNDPAAPNDFMIARTYPGVIALRRHRRAHKWWNKGFKNIARYISYNTRKKTGIDIHPAAVIGKGVFIDHGMGVVIGETAKIGDYCIIFHQVTLGSNTFDKVDRHPKIGSNVIIYTGAKVIGPITIGDNSIISAGAVVVKSAPENSLLIGVPAKQHLKKGGEIEYYI